jgi:hypothetical protein
MVKAGPYKIIAERTDWRFLNGLQRALRLTGQIIVFAAGKRLKDYSVEKIF